MVRTTEIVDKGIDVFLLHRFRGCKPVGLENIADSLSHAPHRLHEGRDFVGVVGVVINDEVPSVIEMNIKAPFDAFEFPEMVGNILEGNSHFMEEGNAGKGIIEVM